MTIADQKVQAKNQYKDTKANYLNNPTPENWIRFCDAKRCCMLLGVRI